MNEQITDQQLNAAGHLTIGGCDAVDLAHQFGTPLVVYDVQQIRQQIRAFKRVFEENNVDYACVPQLRPSRNRRIKAKKTSVLITFQML